MFKLLDPGERALSIKSRDGWGPALEPRRFYSDLLQGRTVVIDAFFASCKDTCPLMADRFAYLQDKLGDRLGRDVSLISISVDPESDTVPVLKSYAGRVKAKRGWYFLTGKKGECGLGVAQGRAIRRAEMRRSHAL
jgi:cytochrome oxidase Cu insertion factor (SCO1/SenC/PrrC family)